MAAVSLRAVLVRVLFFFFQAEDGIRDVAVTGVQTCALPIYHRRYALGGAANVAANVAAIGAEGRLVAGIGDDPRGDSLRGELAQTRLTDRHLVVAAVRPTTSQTRGMARGPQLGRSGEGVGDPVPARA